MARSGAGGKDFFFCFSGDSMGMGPFLRFSQLGHSAKMQIARYIPITHPQPLSREEIAPKAHKSTKIHSPSFHILVGTRYIIIFLHNLYMIND
jgi:hypothetical protein